jgi:hypothetical protein
VRTETEGGVLDTHFGNKTDVDLYRISLVEKNTSDHSKRNSLVISSELMLGYDMLYENHTMETLLGLPHLQLVVEKEANQAECRLHCSGHFKKSDWGHSAIVKMATEDFPVLLVFSDSMLPLEVFDRKYLVEIWLSEAEPWLPSDGLKFYTGGSLFEGRAGSGVFFGGT